MMAALNIQVIASSALHPSGRGQVERLVGTIKTMLRKMLSVKPDFNWEYLPYLCSKILNTSVSPKTGFAPQTMVYGKSDAENNIFGPLQVELIHPFVRNNKEIVEQLNVEINEMVAAATEKLKETRLATNERLNKNRKESNFKVNDYVFVLDRMIVPGNTRPLKTRFHPSPYIVVKPLWATTLVKRLADGYTTLYSNDDLKRYEAKSPLFASLPAEISKILLHDFKDLIDADLIQITKLDTLEIPQGLELFQDDYQLENHDLMTPPDSDLMIHEPEDAILNDMKRNLPPDELTPPLRVLSDNTDKADKAAKLDTLDKDDLIDNVLPGNDTAQLLDVTQPEIDDNDETLPPEILRDLEEINRLGETSEQNKFDSNDTETKNEDTESDSDNSDSEFNVPDLNQGMKLRTGKRVNFKM